MSVYHAKHILLEDLEDAHYIRDKIQNGESFEELAKEYSECDSGENGGDLGKFSSGVMDAEFEKALYHLSPGELSSPVKTKYGYHLILRIS